MCQCLDFRLYNSNDEMVKTNKHFSVSFESSFLVFYNLYNVNASEPVVIWLWGTLKCCWTYKCPMTLKTWTGDIHTMNSVLAAAAQSLQSCPTPRDPMDCSPSGSPVPGILQARTLEWPAISFSNAGKWKVKVKSLSRVRLLATPWTAADQAPPPIGVSGWEYWSGLPLPSPEVCLCISK